MSLLIKKVLQKIKEAKRTFIVAYSNTPQTISSSTDTTIILNSIYLKGDDTDFILNENGTITCKKNGYVVASGKIHMNSGHVGQDNCIIKIFKNSTEIERTQVRPVSSAGVNLITDPVIVQVSDGDILSLSFVHYTSNEIIIGNTSRLSANTLKIFYL